MKMRNIMTILEMGYTPKEKDGMIVEMGLMNLTALTQVTTEMKILSISVCQLANLDTFLMNLIRGI